MSSRPRRSAATKANEVISVHARWADSPERSERSMSSRRSGRASGVSVSRDDASSPGGDRHLSLTVKLPSNKLRQATRGERGFEGGEIVSGKRNRGAKKSYVVDSSPDEDEEEEEEAEIEVEEDDDDEMDVDAEGEEDAEGDIDMDLAPPTITVSKPARSRPAPRASAAKVIQDDDDDDDDLSDPADSDAGDETMGFGDETMADDGDEDAEGEEIEVAGQEGDEDDEEEEDEEEDEGEGGDDDDEDDEDGNPDESIDLTKMTKRQRARFEDDNAHQYMKLSDEVQAKKVFTAEELSMRRQEMARRRRNLSEKRNEEVKMETINKLLKKQAPKINRKAAAAGAGGGSEDSNKPDPVFIRWVSNKNGVRVAVTEEMLDSPAGQVFKPASEMAPGKMVQEVA
ncbi:PAPA-1-like conserved region-domain-containing protein [Fusarium redolens]|uniref:PAPA-1-like conserved region-domain-containing protein n=1 Tax=Fusarium redolens TaxID=48865 RepID=A0A9P9HLH2_FUSRE|nr:PAPA-1-like conserved region-domain-containing protein [Fusarium redolens]KAH7259750.1 PAPA-1-like conserved region-domain-containing protein [Fusarium redolens]